jgi:hypothetical protein
MVDDNIILSIFIVSEGLKYADQLYSAV